MITTNETYLPGEWFYLGPDSSNCGLFWLPNTTTLFGVNMLLSETFFYRPSFFSANILIFMTEEAPFFDLGGRWLFFVLKIGSVFSGTAFSMIQNILFCMIFMLIFAVITSSCASY